MTISNQIQPAIWIHRSRDFQGETNVVKTILPTEYDHYFKIFLPIIFENEDTGQRRKITHEQLAALIKKPFSKSFSQHSLPALLTPFIASSATEDYRILEKLISLLGPETATIYHGIGEENLPEAFGEPWVVSGTLSDFPTVVNALNGKAKLELVHFPNYIFPLDHSWCIGNMIPQSGIFLLGCDGAVAQQLRDQEEMEAVELSPEDVYFGDR